MTRELRVEAERRCARGAVGAMREEEPGVGLGSARQRCLQIVPVAREFLPTALVADAGDEKTRRGRARGPGVC